MTSGTDPSDGRPPELRKDERIIIALRRCFGRAGQNSYRANLYDISCYGCRVALIERPEIDERVWIGFDGLELIAATVCWTQGFEAGLEFDQPIHPAVLALLSKRYDAAG